ncbi:uncharacterized protein BDZ99DRAFT_280462 [Mytilinidion resinicola]|uniref:Uncharacterized protein n=1 Tax=Mytilinidion resinicola TaxID=574789 RepID=A0A6A6YTR0_9PEZI|nr:uncharacterized protein BDZ99DRAFT_280462 [Mytilinidion resinicola]KAF2811763.1 hypothetical protein BDZ99DRAFT_280462 [Mytilinidion resinicola]
MPYCLHYYSCDPRISSRYYPPGLNVTFLSLDPASGRSLLRGSGYWRRYGREVELLWPSYCRHCYSSARLFSTCRRPLPSYKTAGLVRAKLHHLFYTTHHISSLQQTSCARLASSWKSPDTHLVWKIFRLKHSDLQHTDRSFEDLALSRTTSTTPLPSARKTLSVLD